MNTRRQKHRRRPRDGRPPGSPRGRQGRGHPLTLTDAGRVLVARGGRIERNLAAACQELDDIAGLRAGALRIGTYPTAGAALLPPAVTRFRSEHPDIELTVRSARIAGLWSMLDNAEIELSLMWDYDWCRIDREDAVVTPLLEDPPTLLVSSEHPCAGLPAGALPPVKGFWSLTLYNEHHFFHPNELDRYSLGTKDADLRHGEDGSLTLYAGALPPADEHRAN